MIPELKSLLENVSDVDSKAIKACKIRWDNIAKPIGSLGCFEDMIIKIAGIQGSEEINLDKKAIVVLCSDNGVVEEKVTQTDSSVTAIVTENFAKGIANINYMAGAAGAAVIPVDIGVNIDITNEGVLNRKIAYGTRNIAKGPAMTRTQVIKAIETGIDLIRSLKEEGYQIIGTGEMGIGNTTTSSAIASVLLNLPPKAVTGKGAGLSQEGVARKVKVITKAIEVNQPNPEDPLDILEKLGGFDIAGMTGLYLGAMQHKMPIVIDGIISSVAALIAARISKDAISYMLPSHLSKEPASERIMKELGLTPVILGNLALGEGSGAALLFPLLDMVNKVYQSSATFEAIQVRAYERFDVKAE